MSDDSTHLDADVAGAWLVERVREVLPGCSAPANQNGAEVIRIPVSARRQILRDRLARSYLNSDAPE